jgi:hypothetical protein
MNINPIMQKLKIGSMRVYPYYYIPTDKERDSGMEYIIYTYAGETPIFFGDDEAQLDETYITVHIFTQKNPQKYKKDLRRFLRSNGFLIAETEELYEDDTRYYHVVVTAHIIGVVDD